MVKIGDIDPKDKKFWPKEPDPDFNPKKNKAIVEGTIKKYEKKQLEKRKQTWNGIRERANAISYWLRSQHGAESGKSLIKYFGKRYLGKLRGDEIAEEIRSRTRIIQNPFAKQELINRILTGKGTHKIHGSQIKKGNKEKQIYVP